MQQTPLQDLNMFSDASSLAFNLHKGLWALGHQLQPDLWQNNAQFYPDIVHCFYPSQQHSRIADWNQDTCNRFGIC
jgi:hypothetical protein